MALVRRGEAYLNNGPSLDSLPPLDLNQGRGRESRYWLRKGERNKRGKEGERDTRGEKGEEIQEGEGRGRL